MLIISKMRIWFTTGKIVSWRIITMFEKEIGISLVSLRLVLFWLPITPLSSLWMTLSSAVDSGTHATLISDSVKCGLSGADRVSTISFLLYHLPRGWRYCFGLREWIWMNECCYTSVTYSLHAIPCTWAYPISLTSACQRNLVFKCPSHQYPKALKDHP